MRHPINLVNGRIAVYADSEQVLAPIDLYKETQKSGLVTASASTMAIQTPDMRKAGIDVPMDFTSWLPFAAPHYHISASLKDYVLTPVIIMPSDLPNRNAVGFPLSQLIEFNPALGKVAYKTWKGKPTHYEHQNTDITKAYGVIVDTYLRKMEGYGQGKIWKLLALLAFDRSKHPDFCTRVLSGDMNSYSMGAYISSYTCSFCHSPVGQCSHLNPKASGEIYILNGKLVFKQVCGVEGFETSGVESPAYISAISDTLLIPRVQH